MERWLLYLQIGAKGCFHHDGTQMALPASYCTRTWECALDAYETEALDHTPTHMVRHIMYKSIEPDTFRLPSVRIL